MTGTDKNVSLQKNETSYVCTGTYVYIYIYVRFSCVDKASVGNNHATCRLVHILPLRFLPRSEWLRSGQESPRARRCPGNAQTMSKIIRCLADSCNQRSCKKRGWISIKQTNTWIIHTWTYALTPKQKEQIPFNPPPPKQNKTPCLSTRAFILLPHLGLRSNQLKICENFPVNNWVADCHNCIFLAILQIKILIVWSLCKHVHP